MPWRDQDGRMLEKAAEVDQSRHGGTNSAATIGTQVSADGDLDQHSGRGNGGRWQDSSETLDRRFV